MTKLPRLMISLPPDIMEAINTIKNQPEFQRLPKSKIVCRLIRQGMNARCTDNVLEEGKEA